MDRHFEVAPSDAPPSAPAASLGYPTNGNPQTATPATEPGEWWFHMITESLRRVIVGAGLTPSHANLDLLKDSLVGAWRTATEALVGVLRVATQTETDAGTADDRVVTPKKLRWGVSYSISQNGYIVFPSWLGGLILQWGRAAFADIGGTLSVPITFPIALPVSLFTVTATAMLTGGYNVSTMTSAYSLSGFTAVLSESSAVAQTGGQVGWFAIGY